MSRRSDTYPSRDNSTRTRLVVAITWVLLLFVSLVGIGALYMYRVGII